MLRFFKSYEPYFNLVYLALAFGLCVPMIRANEISADLFTFIQWSGIPAYVLFITCGLLIWIGALLSNTLFGSRDFHSISSGMPGLIFVLYTATISLDTLKPWTLLASVILLLALSYQTIIFRQNDVRKECFNAAVCLGLASVLYFPLALLLAAQLLGLGLSRTFAWREYVASLLGFLLPWIWLLAIDWLIEFDLIQLFIIGQFNFQSSALTLGLSPWIVLLAWSLITIIKSYRRSNNASRNTKTRALIFSLALALSIIVGEIIGIQGPLEILAIPMALVIPFLVLDSTSEARAWFTAAIMITGVVLSFLSSHVL